MQAIRLALKSKENVSDILIGVMRPFTKGSLSWSIALIVHGSTPGRILMPVLKRVSNNHHQ